MPLPGIAYGTAPTPDGRFLVVALIASNKVGVLDLQPMTLARTLDVPKAPQEVVLGPDGRRAYVSCDASGKVAAIDIASGRSSAVDRRGTARRRAGLGRAPVGSSERTSRLRASVAPGATEHRNWSDL